jgi:hypothetical protein
MAVTDVLVDLLVGRANGKHIIPPAPPPSWSIKVQAQDSDDMAVKVDMARYAAAGAVLGIDYVDVEGAETSRRIKPLAFKPSNGDWHLYAICIERQAFRCFLASRIQGAVDLRTGEIFDEPSEIFNGILGLTYGAIKTPQDATRVVWRQYPEAINALIFLARCDGHHHPAETDTIMQFIDTVAPAPGIDENHAMELLHVAWVDERHYSESLNKLVRQGPEHLNRVARYARKIIDADGALNEDEARFASQLDQLLR